MATYVYKCDKCLSEMDVSFPMGTAPEYIWPEIPHICNGESSSLKRVFFPTAISFKGSGFYKTDNPKTKHVRSSLKVGGNASQ